MALIQAAWCLRNKKLLPMLGIVLMLTAGVGGQKAVLGNVGKTAGVVVDNAIPLAFLSTAMGMQDYDPFGYGAGSYNGYGWNTFAETGWDQEESVRRALQDMKIYQSEDRRLTGRRMRSAVQRTIIYHHEFGE